MKHKITLLLSFIILEGCKTHNQFATTKKSEEKQSKNLCINSPNKDQLYLTQNEYFSLLQDKEKAELMIEYFNFEIDVYNNYVFTAKNTLNLNGENTSKLKETWDNVATKIASTSKQSQKVTRNKTLDLLNWLVNLNRNRNFNSSCDKDATGLRILAEGDSWFLHPIETDIIDLLSGKYAIKSIAAAGDTVENMAKSREYLHQLEKENFDILLLSGGGNDLFGVDFSPFLNNPKLNPVNNQNENLLVSDKLYEKINQIMSYYADIFATVKKLHPNVKIFCHTYDYATPHADGKYLGRAFNAHSIQNQMDRNNTIKYIINLFYERLQLLTKDYDNVYVIDLRNTLYDKKDIKMWSDEIHANKIGATELEKKYNLQFNSKLNISL